MTILVTGSEGLIGRYLTQTLLDSGHEVRRFDIVRSPAEDVRNAVALAKAIHGVSGVVILGAVSRVIWAERDPARCTATNIDALSTIIRLCLEQKKRPWILFASSREVYGNAEQFPVAEDAPLRPVNLYARSKVKGEALIGEARDAGLIANICRLSSVYGCPLDHRDRVAMAFAQAASFGGTIRLEGADNILDFTSVQDVTRGLALQIGATAQGERLPPIHFVSGQGTTLADLAGIACRNARNIISLEETVPRSFDVPRFVGDPSRAKALLGWSAGTAIQEGLPVLIDDICAMQSAQISAFSQRSRLA
jgi:nucleoside-diphosphate-sugar epimerase